MNLFRKIIVVAMLVGLIACESSKEEHFITDKAYRKEVKQAFEQTKKMANGRSEQLFKVFEQNLSTKEREALEFLYAYMPLSDLSNYAGDFFLKNVRLAFATRDSLSWGKDVPEDVFRHFVLPYRINNENIDTARGVFFKELYPRIKDLNMEDATLEVNHWCHEKVNYKGTDSRTMAPLGVIKTAYGRCGEESTFTVTALRSVGIPARQVYTPRWAHTDDNHAWVEVYVDGTWKFLGACEPAPALNMGWFDAAVLRAMMVHTKAFGKYKGAEKVIKQQKQFSELNLLSNYVAVKDVCVQVQDNQGNIVKDAYVEFGLYNYAEFYPLKKGFTDKNGCISLRTGKGTLRILAAKNEQFGLKMMNVATTDTLKIALNRKVGDVFSKQINYVPPVAQVPQTPQVDEALNEKRFKQEDEMREAYIATFYTKEKARKFAKKWGLDIVKMEYILPEARGNYPEIEQYLEQSMALKHPKQLTLLEVLNPKDLHDITASILLNHLQNFEVQGKYPTKIVDNYILNPRVELEKITPYRAFLKAKFQSLASKDANQTANSLKKWILENIQIDKSRNYYRLIQAPQSVYEIKRADELSRDVFFVTVMRSLGFPARFEEANRKVQYWAGKWIDVKFQKAKEKAVAKPAYVHFTTDSKTELQYRIHFALAKFEDNKFRTIELGWDKKLTDFDVNTVVEPGYYQLLTGNRVQGGSVLIKESFFTIAPGEHKNIAIHIRNKDEFKGIIGKIDTKFWGDAKPKNKKVVAWINPHSEPGKHFIAEYKVLKKEFAKHNYPMTLYVKNEADKRDLRAKLGKGLEIAIDKDFAMVDKIAKQSTSIEPNRYPLFMIVDNQGDISFLSQGYNIGIPEQILKNMAK